MLQGRGTAETVQIPVELTVHVLDALGIVPLGVKGLKVQGLLHFPELLGGRLGSDPAGDEAFKAYVEDFKAQFNGYEDERVEAASPFYNTVGMNYTTSYLEALKNVSTDATNKAEAEEAVAQVKAAAALLEENIALWAEYLALAKEAAALAGNENIDQDDELVQDVTDWADMDAGDAWDEQELTNDELRELIAQLGSKESMAVVGTSPG